MISFIIPLIPPDLFPKINIGLRNIAAAYLLGVSAFGDRAVRHCKSLAYHDFPDAFLGDFSPIGTIGIFICELADQWEATATLVKRKTMTRRFWKLLPVAIVTE